MKLQLYYPVKPFYVGQKFGETANNAYYAANGINFKGHNGLDLAALHGEKVYAAHDGTCYPEVDTNQGHGVVLITDVPFEYPTGTAFYKTIYWHLIDNIPVKWGQKVKAGDLIGYADSTGLSTGDHLHFGLKPMTGSDPYDGLNIEQNNGYMGAIDPTPFFNGKYAGDLNTVEFIFSKDLEFGQTDPDVFQLQTRLKDLGYFPMNQACTNYYGSITRAAVFAFQQDYIVQLSWLARVVYKGSYCSQQTRAALNSL